MGIFDLFSPAKIQRQESTFRFTQTAKVVTLWMIIAVVFFFLFSFYHILPVFIWAAVAAYLFNPVITFFSERTRLSRPFWIVMLYVLLGMLIFFTIKGIMPAAYNEFSELASGTPTDTNTFLGRIASQGQISVFDIQIDIRDQVQNFSAWIKSQAPAHALPIFFGALEKTVFLLVFFIVTFYLLLDSGGFLRSAEKIIPNPYRQEISALIDNVNFTLGAYIRAQIVLIIVMSSASFVLLSVLKVKYALILSLVTGVLEVFPVIGPVCATAIAVFVAFFQASVPFGLPNGLFAIIVLSSYFVLRQLEDYFIIPNVASKFVRVHPIVGIFALLVGGSIGGVLGLFLAIPAAAILKVVLRYLYNKITEE